jgi:hypothetical protein
LTIYAVKLGGSKTGSGLFLAFAFLCLAVGTFASGLLRKDFAGRKWLAVASGLIMVGLTSLTSRTTTLVQFAGVTGAGGFLAGIVFSQAATLTGLASDSEDRRMAFGIIGMIVAAQAHRLRQPDQHMYRSALLQYRRRWNLVIWEECSSIMASPARPLTMVTLALKTLWS